jgi:hypothetical protein
MDVIAGRKTVGRISGDILVNGQPKDQKQWARVCGYVEQNDIHTPATTVKEALQFSARLRLPASVTDDQVGVGWRLVWQQGTLRWLWWGDAGMHCWYTCGQGHPCPTGSRGVPHTMCCLCCTPPLLTSVACCQPQSRLVSTF